jgi:hypothetical protein
MLAAADCAELDAGPRAAKPGTARLCAVTRQVEPIERLIRFVVAPDGAVTADVKRKLPGRGLWLGASRTVVAEALRRGTFGRGFRRDVRVSPDLVAETERLLVSAAIDALAIAGKAGEVAAGWAKVEAALRSGEAVAVLHARDGAADGLRKLEAVARAAGVPVLGPLASAELDLALGRTNVIHAALRPGSAAKAVMARCEGIERFRGAQAGDVPERREAAGTATTNLAETKLAGTRAVPDAPVDAPSDSGRADSGRDDLGRDDLTGP